MLVVLSGLVCVLHVAVFGVSSYYMEKFKPGGGWCSGRRLVFRAAAGVRFLLKKTNKEKKTRKRVKSFIKSVDTDTETYYYTITDTETC